jgi:site-specific DNA recombinase
MAICADLMRDGILTPAGKRLWASGTLSSILRNPAYAGLNYANRWQVIKKNGKRHTLPRPREEWVPIKDGTYPALVLAEQWDAAQTVKAANKVLAARNNRATEDFLLRGGFLVCGACGGSMSSRRYKSGYTVYICHGGAVMHGKRFPAELREGVTLPSANSRDLDAAVWAHIKRLLNEQGFLDAELRRLADNDQVGLDVKAIDARIAEIDAQVANYTLGMATASALTIPLLTEQIDIRVQQRRDLETEREHVARRGMAVMRARDHVEQLKLRLGPQLERALENMPYAERRRTLLALGIRVTVSIRPEKHKPGLPPFTVEASLPLDRVDSSNSELWLTSQSTQAKVARVVWQFSGGRLAA